MRVLLAEDDELLGSGLGNQGQMKILLPNKERSTDSSMATVRHSNFDSCLHLPRLR